MVNRRLRDSLDAAANRARETRDATGKAGQDAVQRIGDVTASFTEKVEGLATASVELARGATDELLTGTASIANQLQQIPGDVLDKLFQECPVPMFILPIGPAPEDFVIVFQFDEMFDNLKSGIFVRPKIEAWAARDEGWDVEHLGKELKREFTRQFDATRERMVKSGEVDIKKLEAQMERQSREMSNKLTGTVSSLVKAPIQATLGGMMLNPFTAMFTWPLGLCYLGLAVYNGYQAFNLPLKYLEIRSNRGETRQELREQERKSDQLEADFDSKNEAFQRAVGNVEIKTHPQLQTLYRLICEKEGISFQPGTTGAVSGDAPDARPYLENRDFRNKLPRRYRNLLKSL